MCGICGIVYADRGHPVDQGMLVTMRDSMTHRGPDDAGLFLGAGIGLGSRRLSILDLSPRGHMPMSTRDGRYWIVYNGEIYNYGELRDRLEGSGYLFQSHTDTEVLLALYATSGSAMLNRLNGMFAFAIWDTQTATLFAARDRVGVKPFYYHVDGSGLFFASEQKALFQAGLRPEFDTSAWEELLCFRYVAGERTPFVGIERLLPGHQLTYRRGKLSVTPWWSLSDRARELRLEPPRDPVSWFRHTFDDAVSIRRISDVPVGVLLSGGLDSSSVAASLASSAGEGVKSFTVRFEEAGFDEGDLARGVADRWQLDFRELTVSPADLLSRLRRATWLNDEPVAHASDVHLGAIAEYAKPQVTVLLSGEGADETLGGYVRYEPLKHPRLLAAARPFAAAAQFGGGGARLRKLGKFLQLGSIRDIGLFNACEVLPADLAAIGISRCPAFPYREDVWDEAVSLFPGDMARQAMFSDQGTFLCSLLDRNDRETMGASIECRVPFLDYRLVEGLAALPSNVLLRMRDRKPLLRRALGDRLPSAIRRAKKWGFGVPWSKYFRTIPELRACVQELPRVEPILSGPFNRVGITRLVDRFLAGDDEGAALVRQLVMIVIWHEVCCTNHQAETHRQLAAV